MCLPHPGMLTPQDRDLCLNHGYYHGLRVLYTRQCFYSDVSPDVAVLPDGRSFKRSQGCQGRGGWMPLPRERVLPGECGLRGSASGSSLAHSLFHTCPLPSAVVPHRELHGSSPDTEQSACRAPGLAQPRTKSAPHSINSPASGVG